MYFKDQETFFHSVIKTNDVTTREVYFGSVYIVY